MGADTPQWLYTSFVDTMEEIGATASRSDLDSEARDLVARWSAPNRRLHTVRHLMNILAHLDELAATAHDPEVLRVAAWYHGASLNPWLSVRPRNTDPVAGESECIDIARTHLGTLGVSDDMIERVVELLLFLARHRAPRADLDAQVLVDADLASLAAPPQEYKKLRENLRAELSELSDLEYFQARSAVIKRLLACDSIYQSPLGESWESAARSNLEAELAKIEASLCACGAFIGEDADSCADTGEDAACDLTSTGTIIIKRRQLKKNCPESRPDECVSTGILPAIAPATPERSREIGDREESASSLESAIEALNLPSTPAQQSL